MSYNDQNKVTCIACDMVKSGSMVTAVSSQEIAYVKAMYAEIDDVMDGQNIFQTLVAGAMKKAVFCEDDELFVQEEIMKEIRGAEESWRKVTKLCHEMNYDQKYKFSKVLLQTVFQRKIDDCQLLRRQGISYLDVGTDTCDSFAIAAWIVNRRDGNGNYLHDTIVGSVCSNIPDFDDTPMGVELYVSETANGYQYMMTRSHDCLFECSYTTGEYGEEPMIHYDKRFKPSAFSKADKEFSEVVHDSGSVAAGFVDYNATVEVGSTTEIPQAKYTVVGMLDVVASDATSMEAVHAYQDISALCYDFRLVRGFLTDQINRDISLKQVLQSIINESGPKVRSYYKMNPWGSKLQSLIGATDSFIQCNRHILNEGDIPGALFITLMVLIKRRRFSNFDNALYLLISAFAPLVLSLKVNEIVLKPTAKITLLTLFSDLRNNDMKGRVVMELCYETIGMLNALGVVVDIDVASIVVKKVLVKKVVQKVIPCASGNIFSFFNVYVKQFVNEVSLVDYTFDYQTFAKVGSGYCYLTMFHMEKWTKVLLLNRYSPILTQRGAARIVKELDESWLVPVVERSVVNGRMHLMKLGVLPSVKRRRTVVRSREVIKSLVNGV